jgi:hypothetical protein
MNPPPSRLPMLCLIVPGVLGVVLAVGYVDVNAASNDEVSWATRTLLTEGFIGNPYGFPTGPTAHVSPLQIAWMAAIYRVLGFYTPAARITLSLFNLACYLGACALVIGICRRVCATTAGVWIGAVLSCLMPLTLYEVVVLFRTADQPFGSLLLILGAYLFVRYQEQTDAPLRANLALGALAGIAGLSSPAVCPSLTLLTAGLAWTGHGWRDRLRRLVFSLGLAALIILPWSIRNQLMLGAFIPFRSNFALEFAMGNQDGATGVTNLFHGGNKRKLHPFQSPENTVVLRAEGEVAYMRGVRQVAVAWVRTHPGQFLILCARRAWMSLIPTAPMGYWGPVLHGRGYLLKDVVGVLEIAGLLLIAVARRNILFWSVVVLLPLTPYWLTHVETRYTLVTFFPALCVIAVGADVVLAWAARRVAIP